MHQNCEFLDGLQKGAGIGSCRLNLELVVYDARVFQ